MEKGLKKFLCDRTFMKAVLAAAIPLMLQQLISSSVNLVDNLMVGQLGDAALSSVAAVNRYYMIALFGTNGLAAAASVFIAQYYGAGEQEHMKQTFRTLLVIASVISGVQPAAPGRTGSPAAIAVASSTGAPAMQTSASTLHCPISLRARWAGIR